MSSSSSFIAIAHLLRPQGRRGELLAEPLTDLPDIFAVGRRLGCVPEGVLTPDVATYLTLEAVWSPTGRNAGRLVLKLSGVDSISSAEAIAGRDLLIDEAELPAREPDTFLVRDLLGCTLYDAGVVVGEVVDLEFPMTPDGRQRLEDAAPLLLVQLTAIAPPQAGSQARAAQEPVMVPFIKAWLQSVDLQTKAIRMTLPEGLINLGGELGAEPAAARAAEFGDDQAPDSSS